MRGIGEMARLSGLTVSALRFYDGAGVFGPAWVDPRSGYRWYDAAQLPDAVLLAALRRVGLPLAGIRAVLSAPPGSAAAHAELDAHLRRLAADLAAARHELTTVRALLARRAVPGGTDGAGLGAADGAGAGRTTTLTLAAGGFGAALDSIRFAAADRPRRPVPGGVLFDAGPDDEGRPVLRLAATDRHRLAVARVAVPELVGPAASAVVPTPVVDGVRALLTGSAEVVLAFDGAGITVRAAAGTLTGAGADEVFPDYRRLTRPVPAASARFAAESLRAAVLDAPGTDTTVLTHDPDGVIAVATGRPAPGVTPVRVNRRYLLEAIAAAAPRHLLLELGGPRSPLAIRDPDDPARFSILMPIA
jgi:DNA-binding transcriptional MerR regulator